MIAFFAHFLFLLAAWTLTIKFAFPIAFALSEGAATTTYVYWDFWWVIHIWLGWSLLHWQRYTYALAVATSVVEIAIVITKLFLFLADPQWSIWQTNWFINKLFVLACFAGLLPYVLLHCRSGSPMSDRVDAHAGRGEPAGESSRA